MIVVLFSEENRAYSLLLSLCSMKSEQSGTEEYGLKSDKVYNFLSMVFTRHDVDNQGCFPVEKFWEIMKQLPLSELGELMIS